jgi:hypothetical protein
VLSALVLSVYANPRYVAASVSGVIRLLQEIDPTSPQAPKSLVPLGLAGFTLPLCTNVFVTSLIAGRIWYISPRKAHDMPGVNFPIGRGRAAIDIVVESGALYLAVQLILVILFAIQHPAQGIACVIAVQIYVRSLSHKYEDQEIHLNSPCKKQGIAPSLIVIRVALGLSSSPSSSRGLIRCAASSQPTNTQTQMRVGYSMSSYTDYGQPLVPEVPMIRMKSKLSEYQYQPSSCGTVENGV